MGGGSYSASTYAATTRAKIDNGTAFSYTKSASHAPRSAWKAHESLDPKVKAGPGSPYAGQPMRESRDNADHPNTVPIIVGNDVTGSMGRIPRVLQEKFKTLTGLLLRQGYVEDPQIAIAAYGDAYCDQVPLQISQFEDDNRMDDNLDNLFIESGGGGNGGETLTLALYYLANHTATDSYEKRGKKGYAFFVADEIALDLLPAHVKDSIGVDEPVGDLSVEGIFKAASEKWDIFILLIDNSAAHWQGSEKFYKNLLGERNVLVVEDPDSVPETIALALGALEGTIDLDEDAASDLRSEGSTAVAIRSAMGATNHLKNFGGGGPVTSGSLDLHLGDSGTTRL